MWLLKNYFRPLKQNPEDLAFPTGYIKYRSVNALSMSLAAGMIKLFPIITHKTFQCKRIHSKIYTVDKKSKYLHISHSICSLRHWQTEIMSATKHEG